MTQLDRADFEFLTASGRLGREKNLPCFVHLDQPISILNYIRIANDLASQVSPCRLLDWGCGFGQMTYLMRRRGFEVTPFDIGSSDIELPDIPLCHDLNVVLSEEPTGLPFPDAGFDAVLGCGVLEHVDEGSQLGNEVKSLREIRRVLRPGGTFFVYQLPQRHAWQEAAIRRFNLGYSHPRRFTRAEITRLLEENGYRVIRVRRANLIPKNLTGMPPPVRRIYGYFPKPLLAADRVLSRLPLLGRLAGVLEISARRI